MEASNNAAATTATGWRAKLLLVGGSMLAALLMGELLLWTLLPVPHPYAAPDTADQRIFDEFRRAPLNRYLPAYTTEKVLQLQPDLSAVPGASPTVRFAVNRFGFRNSRMQELAKPGGELRVFAVGGSTTECLYLDEPDAWPEVLQRELAPSVPGVNVINAGHSGDTTRDHLALLSQRIVPFRPDMVMFLVGVNDLSLQIESDYSPLRNDARSLVVENADAPRLMLRSALAEVSQITRRLILIQRQRLKADARGNPVQDGAGGWMRAARELRQRAPLSDIDPAALPKPEFEENLRTLAAIARSAGATPVFMTQPVLWGAPAGEWEALLWVPYGRRVAPDRLWQVMERFNDVTRRVAAELDVPLIDLARTLPKSTELFYDDDHYTVTGARQVGKLVAEGLREAGALQPRIAAR